MKKTNTMLGRPLAGNTQPIQRQAALTARRKEQSLRRFMESLNNREEISGNRICEYPAG